MFNLINKVKNRKGFTLVELLVVLAVLAIISAIAIPRFAGVQDSAKEKADIETINTVKKAMELWLVSENITYPSPAPTSDPIVITLTKASSAVINDVYEAADNDFKNYIKDSNKLNLQKYVSATFTFDANGNVKVMVVKTTGAEAVEFK